MENLMGNPSIKILSRNIIKNHPVKGTEKITFKYEIMFRNEVVVSSVSTVTLNEHGVKYDITELKEQIPNSKHRSLLILKIRNENWQNG